MSTKNFFICKNKKELGWSFGIILVSLCMDDELRKWQQQLVSEIKTDDQRLHELQSQRNAKYQKLKDLDALIGFSASDELRGESRVKHSQKFLDDS